MNKIIRSLFSLLCKICINIRKKLFAMMEIKYSAVREDKSIKNIYKIKSVNNFLFNKTAVFLCIYMFSFTHKSYSRIKDPIAKIKSKVVPSRRKNSEIDDNAEIPKPKRKGLAWHIADHYIKSFGNQEKEEDAAMPHEEKKKKKAYEVKPPNLNEAEKNKVVFNKIFDDSQLYLEYEKNVPKVLNEYSWDDLKVLYGTTSSPSYHLFSKINNTTTNLGGALLATLLVTPTSDIRILKSRQQIIKAFIKNNQETTELEGYIEDFKDAENSLLSFWTPTDPLYAKEYVKYMNSKFYSKKNKNFNKSVARLNAYKIGYKDICGIFLKFLWPLFIPLMGEAFIIPFAPGFKDPNTRLLFRKQFYQGMMPIWGPIYNPLLHGKDAKKILGRSYKDQKVEWIIKEVWSTIFTGLYIWSIYSGVSKAIENSGVLKRLAMRMADLQNFIKNLEKIDNTIKNNPALEKIYGGKLVKIRELLNTDKNTELGKLVYYMKTLPLMSWSYFFSNAGKLLASYQLFLEHKSKLNDAFFELGQLDLYLSLTRLINESKKYNSKSCFNFVKYIPRTQSKGPYLKIADMWNPFLDSKKAVVNSIVMDSINGIRNIILTGPNAGGKSTYLTGVTLTILLAQTIGIAPAKAIVMTPFNKISTYMNISDDIAAGKSLFMAEVDRAKKHIDTLNKLKEDEYSFTIMDELFSGTNPYEGEAAAYSIMEYFSKHKNALNIIATHFPIVMSLEDNVPKGKFKNYKVYIVRDKKNMFKYTYKVIPGKSNQAIAIEILEQQGYSMEMLEDAKDVLKNRSKYLSKFG